MKQKKSKKEAPWLLIAEAFDVPEKEAKKVARSLHVSEGLIDDLKNLSTEALESGIAFCHSEIQRAVEDVEQNPKYQEASEIVKEFKSALRDATNPQKASLILKTYVLRQKKGD